MAKGIPDSQHELIVAGLGRCLRSGYPHARFSYGAKVSDLNLKPDVFVVHPDGRRWAYEIINKNASIKKIEANHQTYLEAGVQDYWILWEARGPEKPIDDSALMQSAWISDQMLSSPEHFTLHRLHRTLAGLGEGALYVFAINRPLHALVRHWALRLGMIGLHSYRFSAEQLASEQVEGNWKFVPLPYHTFGEQGCPLPKPEAEAFATTLESWLEVPSDRPVFAQDLFAPVEAILESPAMVQTKAMELLKPSLAEMIEQHPLEDITQMMAELNAVTGKLGQLESPESGRLSSIAKMYTYIERLPHPLKDVLTTVIPPQDFMIHVFEMKRWHDEDEHLQALIDSV